MKWFHSRLHSHGHSHTNSLLSPHAEDSFAGLWGMDGPRHCHSSLGFCHLIRVPPGWWPLVLGLLNPLWSCFPCCCKPSLHPYPYPLCFCPQNHRLTPAICPAAKPTWSSDPGICYLLKWRTWRKKAWMGSGEDINPLSSPINTGFSSQTTWRFFSFHSLTMQSRTRFLGDKMLHPLSVKAECKREALGRIRWHFKCPSKFEWRCSLVECWPSMALVGRVLA